MKTEQKPSAPGCAHTPGPWMVRLDLRGDHLTVERVANDLRSVICRFNASDLCEEHRGSIEANGRLIASAPELLAALRQVAETFAVNNVGIPLYIAQAINHAEGE